MYLGILNAYKADRQMDTCVDFLNKQGLFHYAFRPLPYGFTRVLERITGDWLFSCIIYRWFFTYWLAWAWYRFARLFLGQIRAIATLLPLLILYPLSVWYYYGQLTDPLSHFLFVLALIYLIQDRWLMLGAALAVGVLAKETVVLLVACYPIMRAAVASGEWGVGRGEWGVGMVGWRVERVMGWRQDSNPVTHSPLPTPHSPLSAAILGVGLKTITLGILCLAAFLIPRLLLGWRPGTEGMNGTKQLMVWDNLLTPELAEWLGLPKPLYRKRCAGVAELRPPLVVRGNLCSVHPEVVVSDRCPAQSCLFDAYSVVVAQQSLLRLDVRIAQPCAPVAVAGDNGHVARQAKGDW